MSTDHRAVIHRIYADVFEGGDVDLLDELLTDDFVDHEAPPGTPNGRAFPKEMLTRLRGAFPDLRLTVEDVVLEGDRAAIRARMTGTHQGEFAGVPATGRAIDVALIDMMEFEDGRISRHWGVTDSMTMLQQLGVLEAPPE